MAWATVIIFDCISNMEQACAWWAYCILWACALWLGLLGPVGLCLLSLCSVGLLCLVDLLHSMGLWSVGLCFVGLCSASYNVDNILWGMVAALHN